MQLENAIQSRESVDIPGVGEIRARPGTSTLELAGAVKYWHDKAQESYASGISSGRKDGVLAASALIIVLEAMIGIGYHYLRSR